MPRKYSRVRRSSKKRNKTKKKSKKMRGGVTRKLLTRRKVADLTREIGLGHASSSSGTLRRRRLAPFLRCVQTPATLVKVTVGGAVAMAN